MKARMRRRRPVKREVRLAVLVGDLRAVEDRVEGGRTRRIRGPRVVHDALQFLYVREPPVVVAEIFFRVLFLNPGERVAPVHAGAAIGLRPHKAGGPVGYRAVAVVAKIIFSVAGIPARALHEKRLLLAAARHEQVVALDPSVRKIHAEQLVEPSGALADILCGRGVLGIDDTLAFSRVPVGELEKTRVDERGERGGVRVRRPAGIGPAGVEERIEFFDRRQPPVVEPAELFGVELRGERAGLRQCQLVAPVELAVTVGIRASLPGEPGDVVADRPPVGTERVGSSRAMLLGVLPVERLPGLRRGDFAPVVVALGLAGSDDGIRGLAGKR